MPLLGLQRFFSYLHTRWIKDTFSFTWSGNYTDERYSWIIHLTQLRLFMQASAQTACLHKYSQERRMMLKLSVCRPTCTCFNSIITVVSPWVSDQSLFWSDFQLCFVLSVLRSYTKTKRKVGCVSIGICVGVWNW